MSVSMGISKADRLGKDARTGEWKDAQVDEYTMYGTRLLVFLETEPQSNKYQQVILTPGKFKKVSDAVCHVESKEGDKEYVSIQMSEETYDLPDLQEIDFT